MWTNRRKSWLLASALLLLLSAKAKAQQTPQNEDDVYTQGNARYANAAPADHRSFSPFNPVGFKQKFQPFAPVDTSDYGNGPKPRIGYFFEYSRVYMSISAPKKALVGVSDVQVFNVNGIPQAQPVNSTDTGFLGADAAPGNRFEGGYMDVNKRGWMFSYTRHVSQNQDFNLPGGSILFHDPFGFLATPSVNAANPFLTGEQFPTFQNIKFTNKSRYNTVEVMRMFRAPRLHGGGVFDLMYGARFLGFSDQFFINATGDAATLGNFLDITTIENKVQNNIVGPQLAGRYSHQRGRWIFSAEGRFLAGANFQNFRERSQLASNQTNLPGSITNGGVPATGGTTTLVLPILPNLQNFGASNFAHDTEFSPVVELRLQSSFLLTKAVAMKLGYTGVFIDNVSRASNRIDYTLPAFAILHQGTHETVVIQGLNIGFEINR